MEPMDRLFDLYHAHMDRRDEDRWHLDRLYGHPRRDRLDRMTRDEFKDYVMGPPNETKRMHVLRILNGDTQLADELAHLIHVLRPAA